MINGSFWMNCVQACTSRTPLWVTLRSRNLGSEAVKAILTLVRDMDMDRPITVEIPEVYTTRAVLEPLISDIRYIFIFDCQSPRTTYGLASLNLTDLVSLGYWRCHQLDVKKSDFAQNLKLRVITFDNVTFSSIEPGTFTDLSDLQMLSLDVVFASNGCRELLEVMRATVLKLHCDCQYMWLRSWLKANPRLLTDKNMSGALMFDDYVDLYRAYGLFTPVNCANQSFTICEKSPTQSEFTTNDPCLV